MTNHGKDWVVTAKKAFCVDLVPVQKEILQLIQIPGARVSAIETDGMGRNRLYALIIASAVLFNPELKVIFVSDDQRRLCGLNNELRMLFASILIPLEIHHSVTRSLLKSMMGTARQKVDVRYVREGNEECLAGDFNQHSLCIVDNAALISDIHFQVLTACMTESDNRLLLLSEAHRSEGYFYDSHHQLKGRLFHTVCSNANHSPLTDHDWRENALEKLSPADYLRRILGEFPETAPAAIH